MGAIKRKKLCFLASFTIGSLNPVRVFPLTQFRSTGSYTGDLWGNVLDDLAPLTVGSPGWKKQLADVTLWTRLIDGGGVGNISSGSGTSSMRLALDFVTATTDAAAATVLLTTAIKTQDPVTGAATTLGQNGVTPVLTRHFAARLFKRGSTASTCRVLVYAARQHSFEA